MRAKLFSFFSFLFLAAAINAQSPAPIIVQAANAPVATSTSPKTAAVATDAQLAVPSAIKQLEQIKAANDEVLAKQKAALQRLEELQDAADQLRIFAARG